MKIELWAIGKTNEKYLQEGIAIYLKRLKHYLNFELIIIPDIKQARHLNSVQLKIKEAAEILTRLKKEEVLILLDEKGEAHTSASFARFLEQNLQLSHKRMVFLVGGAFGFADSLYERANGKISLSNMTFSHQMVRLFFVEQLYRAMTILKKEPYHNA
jgi:23S rRNA (pseudouridine1915-N3)-methyltransferase